MPPPRMENVQTTTRADRLVSRTGDLLRSPGVRDVGMTLAVTLAGALAAVLALEIAGDYVNTRRDRVLVILGGLAVATLALPTKRVPWGAAALTGTWILGWLAYAEVVDDIFIDTPVDQAAGGAAFYGSPYIPQQVVAVLLGGAVVASAVVCVLVLRRRGIDPAPPAMAPRASGERHRRRLSGSGLATAIGVAVLALTVMPDLTGVALGDPLAPYKSGAAAGTWDVSNLMTWRWLVDDGAVAMKDFFWPYGQTWLFTVFPLGPVWDWLANVIILSLGSWALWRLSPPGGRAVRVLLCALILVFLGTWGGGLWRYTVPLVLALVYAGVGPAAHRTPTWGHLVLALAALNAALWGVDMLVYGLAGMAFVLLGEVLSGRVALRPAGPLLRALLVDALAMLTVLLVPLIWVLQGSLDGNLRLAFGLDGVSAASALLQTANGALRQFIGFKPTYEMVSVVTPALLLAAGLAHAVLGGPRAAPVSRLLLAAGGVVSAVLLKHLSRPQGDLMIVIPILALAWCAVLAWRPRRWVLAAAVGALGTTLLWMTQQTNAIDNYWNAAKRTPERIADNISLSGKTDQIAAVDRRTFQRANLPDWPVERAMAQQLQQEMSLQADDSFAILGDAPFVYIWFKERPPYHVQLYDASKRDEQEEMVEELEELDPNLMLWRRDFAQDGVPQWARNPIVMRWVAERYVPVRRSELSDVLRRRGPGEPMNSAYWQARLGEPLQFGYLPAASDGEDAEECSDGDGCHAYAVLEGTPRTQSEPLAMTISGRGRSFTVNFNGRPDESEYVVRLDRLWFASVVGPNPTVAPAAAGFEARLERRRTGDDLW